MYLLTHLLTYLPYVCVTQKGVNVSTVERHRRHSGVETALATICVMLVDSITR